MLSQVAGRVASLVRAGAREVGIMHGKPGNEAHLVTA